MKKMENGVGNVGETDVGGDDDGGGGVDVDVDVDVEKMV